jgi:integrase
MKKPVVSETAHPRYSWRVQYTDAGKRKSRFFKTKIAAKTFAEQQEVEVINHGRELAATPHALRAEAMRCTQLLEPIGATLTDAVQFYLKHARPAGGHRTIDALLTEFLEAKRKAGRRENYVSIQKVVLGGFAKSFLKRNVHEFDRGTIEQWLSEKPWALRTRRNVQHDLQNLFRFAMQRGHCASNPAMELEEITLNPPPPGIVTIAEAGRLLQAAESYNRGLMLPYTALGLFAGLRTSELERLDWKEIDLNDKTVEVTAEKAKTRARGIVELSENLVEWLKPYAKRAGAITPQSPDYHFGEVRKLAGIIQWPKNAMRHSAASYHLALHKNAALTANLLRHENTRTLFAHYRELVKPKDAELYWKIEPSADAEEKIIAIAR